MYFYPVTLLIANLNGIVSFQRAMESQGVPTGAHNKYSASSNQDDTTQREKRESKIYNLGAMNTCVMELRSDPVFWDKYMELSEGVSSLNYCNDN